MQYISLSLVHHLRKSMKMGSISEEQPAGLLGRGRERLKALPKHIKAKVFDISETAKKTAQDDPRRVVHSLKVGLALTVVSTFYYYQPLYDSFGLSAMWAVMTVVVVFEFSVGATLGKGLNRALATLLAGALGVGAHYLAELSGPTWEPVVLGLFVFLQAAFSTFIRFFPKIKARYDYGLLIFILTFSLISVSGFREDEIIDMAHKRLSTIFIGGSACVMISVFVCPVWAGEDLHDSIALNLEKLGNFLEAFESEYFRTSEQGGSVDNKPLLEDYKSILNSKGTEDSLGNFARWEPCHGRFHFRHPWGQYLKIGALARQCAHRMEALNGHLNSQVQASPEIRSKMKEVCSEMSLESAKALKELGLAVKTMSKPSCVDIHISGAKAATESLNSVLQSSSCQEKGLLAVIPAATVASILRDIVDYTEKIADSVNELASLARFRTVENREEPQKSQSSHCECAEPASKIEGPHVVISIPQSIQQNKA